MSSRKEGRHVSGKQAWNISYVRVSIGWWTSRHTRKRRKRRPVAFFTERY
jgi:hypothetical protein